MEKISKLQEGMEPPAKLNRQKLIEMLVDDVGYHPDEIKDSSDIDLVAIILRHLLDMVENLGEHTHTIN